MPTDSLLLVETSTPRSGRRRARRPTPEIVHLGKIVMAPWGSRHWRAEIVGLFVDPDLAAQIVIEEASDNERTTKSAVRVDVKYLSDETTGKGILFSDLTHTSPEDHFLLTDPSWDPQIRLIGSEIVARRGILLEFDDSCTAIEKLLEGTLGVEETRRQRAFQALSDHLFSMELAGRNQVLDEAQRVFTSLISELESALRTEVALQASREAAFLFSGAHQDRAEILKISLAKFLAEEQASRTKLISDENVEWHSYLNTLPSKSVISTASHLHDSTPRLSHFPPHSHRTRRHRSPHATTDMVVVTVRPPFRLPSSHVELVDARHLPAPIGYARHTAPPGPVRRDPRCMNDGIPHEYMLSSSPSPRCGSSSPRRSNNTTPRPRGIASQVIHETSPANSFQSNTSRTPSSWGTPLHRRQAVPASTTASRGPTPSKASPLPRSARSTGSVAPRYLDDNPLRPTSLAGYWRTVRVAPQKTYL